MSLVNAGAFGFASVDCKVLVLVQAIFLPAGVEQIAPRLLNVAKLGCRRTPLGPATSQPSRDPYRRLLPEPGGPTVLAIARHLTFRGGRHLRQSSDSTSCNQPLFEAMWNTG